MKKMRRMPIKIKARWDDYSNRYRVWRTDWYGDYFEIMTKEDFETMKLHVSRFFRVEIEGDEE